MADVIVIGGIKISREIIESIAYINDCSPGYVVSELENINCVPFIDNNFERFDTLIEEIGVSIKAFEERVDHSYLGDKTSYCPRFGVFNEYLWVNPSEIHDLIKIRVGHMVINIYRKCFMRLKTFSNLRFAR